MILFKTIDALQVYLFKHKIKNTTVGFVPTMGALHNGHLSLIERSKQQDDITVCSIFINPTQFNDSNDFEKYPINIENDILLLEKTGCDILFLPSAKEIYPNGTTPTMHYNLGYLETILEGKFRPNHFQGVCQIVHRLLDIIKPDTLFLGQKDYQQCMVLKKMIELVGFKNTINVFIGNTLREPSGLAMSSRNMRLSNSDKEKATTIHKSLLFIKNNITSSSIDSFKETIRNSLTQNGFEKIDYVEICDADTLEPLTEMDTKKNKVALIAAFLNGVRLIDNMILLS